MWLGEEPGSKDVNLQEAGIKGEGKWNFQGGDTAGMATDQLTVNHQNIQILECEFKKARQFLCTLFSGKP